VHVAELWRYPVKTMAGEPLETARVAVDGIEGDRVVHVHDRDGRVVTSRTRPGLLAHRGTLGDDGEPRVDGRPWRDPSVLADVRRAAGDDAALARFDGVERFDMRPLLVATDGAIALFGHDRRRLRPNIVVGGVDGMTEKTWPGRVLAIGAVRIAVAAPRMRCVMTTYDPDTQAQDHGVLKGIVQRFGGELALDCDVLATGTIAVGDQVTLL
jgi:uncharacterized protein